MDYVVVETNLRQMMRFFAGASVEGEVREMPGVSIVSSGLDFGVLNSAMLSTPITEGPAELERRIAIPEIHFRMRGLRWSYWVCEDMIESRTRRKAKDLFRSHGFRLLSEPPGMIAECLMTPVRPLPAIEVRRVSDAATRFDFAQIVSTCFDLPFTIARGAYTREDAWKREISGYVGYAGGTPVSTVAIVVTSGIIGIYSVATLPCHRGKGYAEALVRQAVAEVRTTTGIERTALQSSPAAFSLYERMGFRPVTRFWVLLTQ